MTRLGLVSTIVLALAVALGLLMATAGDHELASIDIRHPTTILAAVAGRLHAVRSYVGELLMAPPPASARPSENTSVQNNPWNASRRGRPASARRIRTWTTC